MGTVTISNCKVLWFIHTWCSLMKLRRSSVSRRFDSVCFCKLSTLNKAHSWSCEGGKRREEEGRGEKGREERNRRRKRRRREKEGKKGGEERRRGRGEGGGREEGRGEERKPGREEGRREA